jgi:hypothetical protein
MHHYHRRRAWITGLIVELRKIIETGGLVVVVMTRLVVPWFSGIDAQTWSAPDSVSPLDGGS